ncbi:MAG: YwaF family protein [Acholeplasmataceae bacterium]|nr:YwaF family protein [Acholeplasmataceae bacterium]
MIEIIIILITTGILFASILFVKKGTFKFEHLLKTLTIALVLVYLIRLFSKDVFDQTFNLLYVDIETDIDADQTWLFSRGMTLLMLFLRWLTVTMITLIAATRLYQNKRIEGIIAFVGTGLFLVNIVLYRQHVTAFVGDSSPGLRGIQFAIETILLGSFVLVLLYRRLQTPIKATFKSVMIDTGILGASMMAVMPLGLLYHLFGYYGEVPDDFSASHLFVIIFPFVLMALAYALMRKKDQHTKDLMIVYLVIAAFFQYFYIRRPGLVGLPLHLCNAAILVLVVSVVFKFKKMFYFTYFANVIGALAAIMIPNYSQDFFHINVLHFGFNHMYALIIPILAVALKTFPRPKLSNMIEALVVFTIYFVLMVFLNAWFNNYAPTDYFFTYSDHITDLFDARKIQYNNIFEINVNGLTFVFHYAYHIIFYISFVFLMFMNWYVYDALFQTFDTHAELRAKQKTIRLSEQRLLEMLGGRPASEPINPGGQDMIKISHFSKRYGSQSDKAVDDFSLEIHKGEVFGFLGHNGAGKSTTIKSLVGIQSITEGTMEICGYDISTQPLEAKMHIGYVSDNHAVYEKLTGREYINYVADLYHVAAEVRDERLGKYVSQFNLAHAIDREIKSYSHGMKQKLVVIAALVHEPPVWILDEPLTGLDPTSAYQIKESMREHAEKGNIVFFSSHVIEVVEKICHRIAIISKGKLQGIYDMEELKKNNVSLEDLYMKHVSDEPLE